MQKNKKPISLGIQSLAVMGLFDEKKTMNANCIYCETVSLKFDIVPTYSMHKAQLQRTQQLLLVIGFYHKKARA